MILGLLLLVACDPDVDSCAIVADEWDAQLAIVQACETADDCGYPLPGTSCGCTRNLVANNTADTEELYHVLQVADDLDCELIPDTACDCPDAAGFVCDGGVCAWDYIE